MIHDQLQITSSKLEKGFVVCEPQATKLFTKPTGKTGQGLVTKAPRPMNTQLFTTFGKKLTQKSFTSIESL